jgi:hypothetical protein
MKIGKWFAKLAQSNKVASIQFNNRTDDACESATVTLREGFSNKDVVEFMAIDAHNARLFIQGARQVKAPKVQAAAVEIDLSELALAIALEATRIKSKITREKTQGRFLAARRMAAELVAAQ